MLKGEQQPVENQDISKTYGLQPLTCCTAMAHMYWIYINLLEELEIRLLPAAEISTIWRQSFQDLEKLMVHLLCSFIGDVNDLKGLFLMIKDRV